VVDADDLMADMFDTAAKTTEEMGKVDGFSEEIKTSYTVPLVWAL
jgi:arginyl-tRNA synthetase